MGQMLLLVEDDPTVATMLSVALRRSGFEVMHAPDCKHAVEAARATGARIGVVLCDVILPDGSGRTVAAAVREFCPDAWVIFTSGCSVDILTERGFLSQDDLTDAGTTYLPKPFLPRDVRELVGCAFLTKVDRRKYAAAAR